MEEPNSQTIQPSAPRPGTVVQPSNSSSVLPQPAATPMPSAEAALATQPAPPVSPAPPPDVAAYIGMSSSQPNPPQGSKKWLIIGAGILLLIIIVVIGIVVIYFANPLQTTSYDNGQGNRFTLKFYRAGTVKPAASLPPFTAGKPFTGAPFLVGPTHQGTALALRISKNTGKSIYENSSLCKSPVFKVAGGLNGQSGDVCALRGGGKDYLYFFEVKHGADRFLVFMLEDYDYAKANQNAALAKQVSARIDLKKYAKDLQTILSSIQVND